ncbi:helix-turn-helix domain-containing protein [Thalassobacter stenotrophicus]|uniref:Uncharacterized protein n=2 Tax=Thalassobacter stenotrophicus TaxID=266809 RepID=A0A0N7LSU4_9RHOB|nr:helix-turn-helix domain-containing protein [Thalassobacter stenotrophicus]CUH58866.1 hypothetical protein THS5294_00146 [Thalassobacter stenotrophicus]SHJ33370.1 Helix-turn-helix domain-containing protein [Thalassobacter stenotrophicus DSM 16310]
MSHAATNWAIQQRGLKPTTKIVLWHLCDRFNPDFGCFPTQARLAHDCEIGRATLNRHLDELEARRLIKRVRIVDTKTGQQRPTRYLLGFEFDDGASAPTDGNTATDAADTAPSSYSEILSSASQNTTKAPCLDLGHGPHADPPYGDKGKTPPVPATPCPKTGQGELRRPVSHIWPTPCLKNGVSRVSNRDTNLVREPLRKPVKEEEDAQARKTVFDDFFGKLLTALGFDPDGSLPGWWQGWPPREHVRRWQEVLGLTEAEILEAAKASRADHPEPPDGPKALDRVMQRAAQRKAQAKAASDKPRSQDGKARRRKPTSGPAPSTDELAFFYAERVKGKGYLPPSMISHAMCQAMLERKLVTRKQLQMRGVL